MTGELAERVSPDRGAGHVLTRNELLADLLRTRVRDGKRQVLLRVRMHDGREYVWPLDWVGVDHVEGTLDLVSERVPD